MRFIKQFDTFGAPLIFNIHKDIKYHKTVLGGISSVIIYSLILAYAIINLRWWANGELLPTITTEKSQITTQFIPAFVNLSISMNIATYNDSAPYQDKDHQYFTVVLEVDDMRIIAELNEDNIYTFNLTLTAYEELTSQGAFQVFTCDPKLIISGQCEESTVIEELIGNNAYYLALVFNLTYINPQTYEVNLVKQIAWVGMENGFTHMSTINLGATLFKMQKAAIIQQEDEYYGFTTQKQLIETHREVYAKQAYQGYASEVIPEGRYYIYQFFTVDLVSDFVRIQYPSIFTILGNIGAIGGILLYLRHILYYLNTTKAEELLLEEVIFKLFPRCQQIKVKKSFQQIKSVSYQNKAVEIQRYLKFQEVMKKQIYQNFSVVQIVLNQILLAKFMKELHPNFKYAGTEFEALFQYENQLNTELDPNKKIHNDYLSIRSVNDEPIIQVMK